MNNEELLKRIEALEEWKAERERQQISFPLDKDSFDVLNQHFMSIVDDYVYFAGASANPFHVFTGIQDGRFFEVSRGLTEYVASAGTDTVAIPRPVSPINPDTPLFDKVVDDEQLLLFTTDTAPGGLTAGGATTYHVINAASNGLSFQVSTSQGGSAVDITSAGSGRQFFQKI